MEYDINPEKNFVKRTEEHVLDAREKITSGESVRQNLINPGKAVPESLAMEIEMTEKFAGERSWKRRMKKLKMNVLE